MMCTNVRKTHSRSAKSKIGEKSGAQGFSSELGSCEMTDCFHENKNILLLSRYGSRLQRSFVHAVADISINELKVHHLGSTKFVPDEPYQELNRKIIRMTK